MLRALLTHTLIYGAATILTRGASLALLLILPFVLAPAEYGALALIMTVNTFAMILIPMEVTQGLTRYFPASAPDAAARYASTAWWFTCAMLALMLVTGQALAEPAAALLLGQGADPRLARIAFPMFAGYTLFYFVQAQFRWEFRAFEYLLVSAVFSALMLLLAIGLGSLATRPLEGVLAGQAVAALLAAAIGALRVRKTIFGPFDRSKLDDLLRYSLPLVPGGFAIYVTQYASRFVLNGYASLADVGIFTFASQIAGIATLLTMGVQASLAPLVMARFEEPETPRTIGRALEAFAALSACLCLFLGLVGPDAIRHLGNSAYEGAGPLILILAPATVMSGLYVFAPGFSIAKRTGLQMAVSLFGAAASLLFAFLLIPRFGAYGAAWGTLIASVLWLGLWFVLSHRLYAVPVRWLRLAALLPMAAAAVVAAEHAPVAGPVAAIAWKIAMIALFAGGAAAIGMIPVGELIAHLRRRRAARQP